MFMNCQSDESEQKVSVPGKDKEPDQEYWDFKFTLSSKGIPYAEVIAGHSSRYLSENNIYLDENIRVDFFDDEGKHTSVLTAEEGFVQEVSNNMVARDNVVVSSDSGVTLKTEELQWIEKENKIITDKYVTLITSSDTLYGYGFTSDRSLKNWEIKKPTGVSHKNIK